MSSHTAALAPPVVIHNINALCRAVYIHIYFFLKLINYSKHGIKVNNKTCIYAGLAKGSRYIQEHAVMKARKSLLN